MSMTEGVKPSRGICVGLPLLFLPESPEGSGPPVECWSTVSRTARERIEWVDHRVKKLGWTGVGAGYECVL